MVDREPVVLNYSTGVVGRVEFWAGDLLAWKGTITVGVFQPDENGDDCAFRLKEQTGIPANHIKKGFNSVCFSHDEDISVQFAHCSKIHQICIITFTLSLALA